MPGNLGTFLGGVVNQRNAVASQDLQDRTLQFQEQQAVQQQNQQQFQTFSDTLTQLAEPGVLAAERGMDFSGITDSILEQTELYAGNLERNGRMDEARQARLLGQGVLASISSTPDPATVARQEAESTNIINQNTAPTSRVLTDIEKQERGIPLSTLAQEDTVTGEISVITAPSAPASRASDYATFTVPGTDQFQTFNARTQINEIDAFLVGNPRAIRVTSYGVSAGSLEALGADTVTNISTDRVEELRGDIRSSSESFVSLGDALTSLEAGGEGTTGIRGMLARNVGGLLQQGGPVGQALADMARMDPSAATEVRSRMWRVIAQNLERVTAEESGRYTEAERRIAANVLGNIELETASFQQILTALGDAHRIEIGATARTVGEVLEYERQLGNAVVLGTQEGDQRFIEILRSNGITDEETQIAVGNEIVRLGLGGR